VVREEAAQIFGDRVGEVAARRRLARAQHRVHLPELRPQLVDQ
jgi:hypothetical protein